MTERRTPTPEDQRSPKEEGERLFQEAVDSMLKSGEYPAELWQMVQEYAVSLLKDGRLEFDVPHTRAVVYWMIELVQDYNKNWSADEQVSLRVPVTAAWLHDIGYYGQFEAVASHQAVKDKKVVHMERGAAMAWEFLTANASHLLSPEQIEEVAHLVSIHDNLDLIEAMKASDKAGVEVLKALLLVEADTLGMIDVRMVEPTYKGEDAINFLTRPNSEKRHGLFTTPLAIREYPVRAAEFKKFVIQRDLGGVDPRTQVIDSDE